MHDLFNLPATGAFGFKVHFNSWQALVDNYAGTGAYIKFMTKPLVKDFDFITGAYVIKAASSTLLVEPNVLSQFSHVLFMNITREELMQQQRRRLELDLFEVLLRIHFEIFEIKI